MRSTRSKFITATIIFALTPVSTFIGELQQNSSMPVHYFVRKPARTASTTGTATVKAPEAPVAMTVDPVTHYAYIN